MREYLFYVIKSEQSFFMKLYTHTLLFFSLSSSSLIADAIANIFSKELYISKSWENQIMQSYFVCQCLHKSRFEPIYDVYKEDMCDYWRNILYLFLKNHCFIYLLFDPNPLNITSQIFHLIP